MSIDRIHIWGLKGIPEVKPGDSLCTMVLRSLREAGEPPNAPQPKPRPLLPQGSILVVAQKIVSKAEGSIVALDSVVPSARARAWASQYGKDPRIVEVVLRESERTVRMDRGVIIVETRHGFICANAGVDASNAPPGCVTLLPRDADQSARRLRLELERALGIPLAVIISDTFGRPWRKGLANVALGVSGLSPFIDYRGQVDSYGRHLHSTVLALADELAAAAELVMGKTLGIPVAVIEGFRYPAAEGSGRDLIRAADEDLFR